MSPVIRDARIDDGDGVVRLVADYDRERGKPSDLLAIRGAVLACMDLPEHDLVVAVDSTDVIGYVAVHWIPFPMIQGCEGYISDLLVRRDWRGRGVGRLLLTEIETRAKATGGTRLMLHNRMARESFVRGFFAKSGFLHRADVANFVKPIES